MTEPLSYALILDISVEDPSPVLDAAARELVRRRHAASVDGARALLSGDVSKALTVLIELHDLASAGAVVLQVQSVSSEPTLSGASMALPTVLAPPGA